MERGSWRQDVGPVSGTGDRCAVELLSWLEGVSCNLGLVVEASSSYMHLLLHWSLQLLNICPSKFKNYNRRAHPDGLNPLNMHTAQWDAMQSQCPDPTPASISSISKLVHVLGGGGVEVKCEWKTGVGQACPDARFSLQAKRCTKHSFFRRGRASLLSFSSPPFYFFFLSSPLDYTFGWIYII